MEMRVNSVDLAGRLVGDPVQLAGDEVHFRLQAVKGEAPFHCFCDGTTAENLLRYCQDGDEFSIEGELRYKLFANEAEPRLLIYARYTSYGRKLRTLR